MANLIFFALAFGLPPFAGLAHLVIKDIKAWRNRRQSKARIIKMRVAHKRRKAA